ncbi:hypothetical protein ACHAWX_000707 [Stephanocyclus meneghinianus]
MSSVCVYLLRLLYQLGEGKKVWVQFLTLCTSSSLTYAYTNVAIDGVAKANTQLAIMTVITLVGASPFSSSHLIAATIGAFVGGQHIIGSFGAAGDAIVVTWDNYLWLCLLGCVVGLIWNFIMSPLKILDGFAGRLGTAVFLGMNLVMLAAFGPFHVVRWDQYYFGLNEKLTSAEDSIPLGYAWFQEAEMSIGYIIAVVFMGVWGGGTRIWNQNYLDRQRQILSPSLITSLPAPFSNILLPVFLALFSMLAVIISGYKYSSSVFNGFAVGTYVAMASLQQISSTGEFAIVSLLAAGWGLALTPFFVGFAGSMCNCGSVVNFLFIIRFRMSISNEIFLWFLLLQNRGLLPCWVMSLTVLFEYPSVFEYLAYD